MKKQFFLCFGMVFFLFNSFLFSGREDWLKGKSIYPPVTDEQAVRKAHEHIDNALLGGVVPGDRDIIKSIQEKAHSGGYTSKDPIGVIFSGIKGAGKTELTKQFMTFFGKEGVFLVMGKGYSVEARIKEEIRTRIDEERPCTFVLDEFDWFFIKPKGSEPKDIADCIREKGKKDLEALRICVDDARRKNIENDRQDFFFFGATNYWKEVPEEIIERFILIKVEPPNLDARIVFLTKRIAGMPEYIDRTACGPEVIEAVARKMENFFSYRCIKRITDNAMDEMTHAELEGRDIGEMTQEEIASLPNILKKEHLMKAVEYQQNYLLKYEGDEIVDVGPIQPAWPARLNEWIRYCIPRFFFNKIPKFGKNLVIKILSCFSIKRFLGTNAYWPFSRFSLKKHS